MSKLVHPIAGTLATLLVASFWLSTVLVEAFGTHAQIIAVKLTIPWGFLLLVPALAATGSTGLIRSRGHRGGLVGRKLKRMPIIAANGVLVLIPSALFLAWKANAGAFDAAFAGDAAGHEGEVAVAGVQLGGVGEDAIAAADDGIAFIQIAHQHASGGFVFHDNNHVHPLAGDADPLPGVANFGRVNGGGIKIIGRDTIGGCLLKAGIDG